MKNNWVDFKAIKAAVSMEMILGHYGVNWLRKKDDELRGRCPIHQGEGQSTFHVSLSKKVFHCFSCKARGNVLDFVAAMEKCSVRDAGLKLTEWFAVSSRIAAGGEAKSKIQRRQSVFRPATARSTPHSIGATLRSVRCYALSVLRLFAFIMSAPFLRSDIAARAPQAGYEKMIGEARKESSIDARESQFAASGCT